MTWFIAKKIRRLFGKTVMFVALAMFVWSCAIVSGLEDFTISSMDTTGTGGSAGAGGALVSSGAGGNSIASSSGSATSTSGTSSSSSATGSSSSSAGGMQSTVSFGENGTETYAGVTTDTSLDQTASMANFGGDDVINVDPSPFRIGLLRFDLSAVPTTAQVIAAELHVHVGGNTASDGTIADIVEVLESWVEGTNTGQMGVANWQQRVTGTAWMAAGAAPPSRGNVVFGSFAPTKANTLNIVPLNAAGLAAVQKWIGNPNSNHGFAFPPSGGGWAFQSSEAGTSRPALVLTVIK